MKTAEYRDILSFGRHVENVSVPSIGLIGFGIRAPATMTGPTMAKSDSLLVTKCQFY